MGTQRTLIPMEPFNSKLEPHKILKGHFPSPYKDL